MHKIIISIVTLSTFALTETSYSFLGTQASYVNYNETSAPSLGFKYGTQRGMWRSSFNLDHSTNGSNKLTSVIFQADRGILKKTLKNSPFKPHLGFSLGFLKQNKDKGYGIGLNGGVTYLLNEKIDLDLSYRYLSATKITQINSLNSMSLSLHYFY